MRPRPTIANWIQRAAAGCCLAWMCFVATPLEAARTHVVQRGETLSSIATKYGLTVKELARANRLRDADLVRRGQKLEIPEKPGAFIEHPVTAGESLASIAARYRVSVADIRAHNELRNPNHITVGQVLRVPGSAPPLENPAPPSKVPAPRAKPDPAARDPRLVVARDVQQHIDGVRMAAGRWKHIVIHHSATTVGSATGMDRYHREERHMENGLAYHFVIGNGRGMEDGAIAVGRRWKEQLDGGHLAIPALNASSIGICLVGDFQKQRPTRRQLDSLEALVRALMRKTRLNANAVTTHSAIHPAHTKCPGKYFPTESFAKRLKDS